MRRRGVQHRPLLDLQKANLPGVAGQSSVSCSLAFIPGPGDQQDLVTVHLFSLECLVGLLGEAFSNYRQSGDPIFWTPRGGSMAFVPSKQVASSSDGSKEEYLARTWPPAPQ